MANQMNAPIVKNCAGLSATDHVKMSDPRTNAMGGQSIYLNKSVGSGKWVFQLNNVSVPFGVSSFQATDQVDAPAKLSVDISFRDLESNPKLAEFHRFVKEVDAKVMQSACDGLLGAPKSMEVVKELFKPTIRSDPNGKYSDTMKFGITVPGGHGVPSKLYNDKKVEVPLTVESIPKGAKIDLIVEMGAVWIIGKKNLGITWRAPQIRIKELGDKLADYAFVDSDDEGEQVSPPVSPPVVAAMKAVSSTATTSDEDLTLEELVNGVVV